MPTIQDMMFGQKGFFTKQEPSAESDAAAIARLDRLSIILDSAIRVPIIGTRIGLDPILNFVPVAGVVVAKSLTAYIIWEAHRLGVPKRVLGRMLANLGIDFGISIVPLAGWVGDAFFRANLRNVALLKAHLHERSGTHRVKETAAHHASTPIIDGEWVRNAR
ncbi:DUF4112 domain-containing protein [Tianweitania sp. BSSL-BM11]|uniref:DUF4112 domain-containing protein n=1 Tax=Tianweitania aestuarii TaxID=2814886 RepID=A0ABS5RU44_9HYPH|nr:DUF4112 domain-containing protein [Tianweitania aestuarii]MBS9720568.1 DUF4112 domain-containing protein [Tianweitania aestuarii]